MGSLALISVFFLLLHHVSQCVPFENSDKQSAILQTINSELRWK